ncbi:MAG: ROK family transcriptional regulator [Wenzhouxiangellaceae bacterium]|nr:ROK family transcriptional regulator [Wenzhouxiangellaceae bacterium]
MAKGSNSSRLGRYNRSILLTELRRSGSASKAVLAQRSGLSPQAVTRIVDELEQTGMVSRSGKQRGGKGQPSILYRINPSGAYAIGAKIGRRFLDLLVMDFGGTIIDRIRHEYPWPEPEQVLQWIDVGIRTLAGALGVDERQRLMGVGVAMPWFLGQLEAQTGMSRAAAEKWRCMDFDEELRRRTTLPVFFENDDSAAAIAELLFGCGTEVDNFLYVFLGTFVGGGVIIDGNLMRGVHGNSGALASLPVPGSRLESAEKAQPVDVLMNRASLFVLTRHLHQAGVQVSELDRLTDLAGAQRESLEAWLDDCADALAHALVGVVAVLDTAAIVIDSLLPPALVTDLVERVRQQLGKRLPAELIQPDILQGRLGASATVMGGAILPFYSNFVLDRTVLLTGGVPRRILA